MTDATQGQHGGGRQDDERIDPDSLSWEQKVMLAADGEAPEAVLRELAEDARAQRAIAFERALRERIAAAFGRERAPEDLRRRIESLLAQEQGVEVGRAASATVGPPATRQRSFWTRRSFLGWAAAAAAVALTATLTMVFALRAAAPTLPAQVAAFLEQEHSRCADLGEYFDQKMVARDEAEAKALLQRLLNVADGPKVDLRQAGFVLLGAGPCHVPGKGPSAHLLYGPSKESAARQPLSVFVQRVGPSDVAARFRLGLCYELLCGDNLRDVIAAWRVGEAVVYVYCPDGASRLPRKALQALGAPTQRVALGA